MGLYVEIFNIQVSYKVTGFNLERVKKLIFLKWFFWWFWCLIYFVYFKELFFFIVYQYKLTIPRLLEKLMCRLKMKIQIQLQITQFNFNLLRKRDRHPSKIFLKLTASQYRKLITSICYVSSVDYRTFDVLIPPPGLQQQHWQE